MNPHGETTGFVALDELGRRLEAVVERPRRFRPRRWVALSLGVLALAATPALASVSGIFGGTERVEDTLPQVGAAVDRDDPQATAVALEQRGFRVHWVLITDNPERARDGAPPTQARTVAAPPAGTKVLAVLNADGGTSADSDTRDLMIEVSPADSEILDSHR